MVSGHAPSEAVVAVAISHSTVAALVVSARLYARLGLARSAGLDDLFISLALVFAVATTITQCIQVTYGMGTHQADISPDEFMKQSKALYFSIWLYNLSLSTTKLSIILQYLRIFPQRKFRIACYIMIAAVIAYGCYCFFTAVFMCVPIAAFWDISVKGGKCLNRLKIWFANAGLNIASDIAVAILPLPVLNQLELPKRQRRALMIVFALGGFTCIVSILRLQSLYVVSQAKDVSWENPLTAIWSNVEIHVAIVCSCLPTLRALFPRLLRSHLSITRSNGSRGEDNEESGAGCGPRFPTIRFTSSATPTENSQKAAAIHSERSYGSHGGEWNSKASLEAFGRSLNLNKNHARQGSRCVRRESGNGLEEDIEFTRLPGSSSNHLGGIRVDTAIEQEVEKRTDSDSESTRDLVSKKRGGFGSE